VVRLFDHLETVTVEHTKQEGRNIMNNWIATLLGQVVAQMSPEIRKGMVEFVNKLEAQAKATPNPWDDIFVGIVKFVLVIK